MKNPVEGLTQSEIMDKYYLGMGSRKLAFINKNNEIVEGRLDTYLEDSSGKIIGLAINDEDLLFSEITEFQMP